jgi:hypothetical protein
LVRTRSWVQAPSAAKCKWSSLDSLPDIEKILAKVLRCNGKSGSGCELITEFVIKFEKQLKTKLGSNKY